MSSKIVLRKFAASLMLLALPVATTGCASGGWGGWGWSPWSSKSTASSAAPAAGSFSLNPWKGSSSNQVASKDKPSNNVPTPPASALAGSGMARGSGQSTASGPAAPTYNASSYQGSRPSGGVAATANDYGARQTSATSEGGYYTGPYSTNGSGQQSPYAGPGAGAQGYSTADRRGEAGYAAGTAPQGNGQQPQPSGTYSPNPAQNTATGGAYNPASPGYGSSAPGYNAGATSPYQGAAGHATGVSRGAGAAPGNAAEAYRPGSTSRAAAVQPASFNNSQSDEEPASYPMTAGGAFDGETSYR